MTRPCSVATALLLATVAATGLLVPHGAPAADEPAGATRTYENRLTPIANPAPILGDHPEYVEPIRETARFEAPTLVDDPGADLSVRAWRFSYNARGIIEIPNRLRADRTAIVVVHPWGIDDGQGWVTPQPAGAAFQCTPAKNAIVLDHGKEVIDPLLRALRPRVKSIVYSLPGTEDPIRRKLYRSVRTRPTETDRQQGAVELAARLASFRYEGSPLPAALTVSTETPVRDYFKQFRGLDAGPKYDPEGFWKLPIPVMRTIAVAPEDVVVYDAEGYELLKTHLQEQGVRHVLLAGYNTDMCVCSTTAGYENLRKDFDVFLVGDATIATFPAHPTPRFATTAAVSFAALDLLITQGSWIRPDENRELSSAKD
ncbi:isochorismatase family protein [Planctomyces sp. SH-PL14]|uniref:isochorismatase family protein n=1 Tax=Planctomyces sp. SH-PL14 TaxID=1632864 RepID=UPI00078E93D9|nr:isochorismatase family protein [Planctomyces sp. SH-PL14]AMV16986.1 Isochorismatase family protein [Planctomyces sp. SH-PL14]